MSLPLHLINLAITQTYVVYDIINQNPFDTIPILTASHFQIMLPFAFAKNNYLRVFTRSLSTTLPVIAIFWRLPFKPCNDSLKTAYTNLQDD